MALVSTQNALLLAVAGVIYWYMNQPGKIHIQEKLNEKYDYIIGKNLLVILWAPNKHKNV